MIKLCDNLVNAEKQNYIVDTKDLLCLTMESTMLLLGHINFSIKNVRKDRIRKDLHSLCEAGNPAITLLLGDNFPKKVREAQESPKFTSHTQSQTSKRGQHSKQ